MDPILDTTIGLVFIYLLLALVVTVLTEAISNFLKLRSRNLAHSLDALLGTDGETLRDAFNTTGIIRAARKLSATKGKDGKNRLTYIAPENFANAVVEMGNSFSKAQEAAGTAKSLASCINSLPDSDLKNALSAVIDGVGDDIREGKKAIADWFDQTMAGAAERYKGLMQKYAFIAAAIVAIGFNADTLTIANALWNDDTLRAQVVENAEAFSQKAQTVDDLADFDVLKNEMRPFPIGWDMSAPRHSSDWYFSPEGWLKKIVGLLVTALAVSLGAPFWFDLLRKLVAIRSGGRSEKK